MYKLFMIPIFKLILIILLSFIGRYIFQKGTIKLCCPSCKIKIKQRHMKLFNGPFGLRKPAPCPHCGTIIIPDRLSHILFYVFFSCCITGLLVGSFINPDEVVVKSLFGVTGITMFLFVVTTRFVKFKDNGICQ